MKHRTNKTFDMRASYHDNREILAYNEAARKGRLCAGGCDTIVHEKGAVCSSCASDARFYAEFGHKA